MITNIYNPTIVDYPDGVVSIKSLDPTTPYNQIQASLGSSIYELLALYYKTITIAQLLQPLPFYKYDANGNIDSENITLAVDPYQKQSVLNVDLKNKNMVFDGQLNFTLSLLPLERCTMIFTVFQKQASDLLPISPMFAENDFFKGFKEQLQNDKAF